MHLCLLVHIQKNILCQRIKLVPVPDGVSDEVASCITLKGITAEYLLHRAYPLKKGDKVLYHAAAGALGQILCPWANSIGAAKLLVTVGSKEKEEIAKKKRLSPCN